MSWNSAIIIIGLLLVAFAAWREYQRGNKAHLPWRMVAALFCVVALGCIIYPLTYSTTVTTSSGRGKILLTEGFDADSLNQTDSIFTLDKAIHQQYRKAKLLDNVKALFSDSAHITPMHVFGYGLNDDELSQLVGKAISFHPSLGPDGFITVNWTEKVKTGQPFSVQGRYKNTSAKAVNVLLKGLNTTLDSVVIPGKSTTSFTLISTPKSTGRLVYHLSALNRNDTLQQESLPVIISKNQPLKVLLLSASPDFETKFLKNWMGGNGYSVASRSVITKGKFGQEYFNMDKVDLSRITTALLAKFDLVVGDLSVFKNLNATENAALQQDVSQKGLGVIIRADSSDKKASWLQSAFPLNYQAGKQAALTALNIRGKGKTAKLNLDPLDIVPQNNTQSLITDEHGRTHTAITLNGAGKLVFCTVNNTYSWMLAGNQSDYAALWSLLIEKAARRLPIAESWGVATSLPMTGKPVQLVSESTLPYTDVIINQTISHPQQNPALPFQRSATYWPSAYGWQQVAGKNGPFWWYTWQKKDWQSLSAAAKISSTQKYIKANPPNVAVTKQIQQKTSAGVPKVYFYMLFLVAATFLWAESKFFS